jgi:type II secretory pathway pseudopilin PulG
MVELIVAAAILLVVALVAIPRLSQADQRPDEDAALRQHLKVLRVAIERYRQDHGTFPGARSDGQHPAGSPEAFAAQLSYCTDADGHVSPRRDDRHCFGPYLRDGIPPCPVPPHVGGRNVVILHGTAGGHYNAENPNAGWIFNCDTGHIAPNSDSKSADGRAYVTY